MKIASRWAIRVAGTLAMTAVPTVALAGRTLWCSEETAPATCGDQVAHGLHCRGDYCDDVALECGYFGNVFFQNPQWSRWFSEEGGSRYNTHVCTTSSGFTGVVTGIKCRGDYCDDISLQCSEAWAWTSIGYQPISPRNCSWTFPISEEAPSYVSWDRFIAGMQCLGDYCDDKRLLLCTW